MSTNRNNQTNKKNGSAPKQKGASAKINVSVGYATLGAEEINGDTSISLGLGSDSKALILSDGMGRGKNASLDSKLVANRLRKNLKNGMTVANAIKEVNTYLLEHNSKTYDEDLPFATVDLTVIDCIAKRAKFYKMGATTSFLVRGKRIRKIAKNLLPVGVVPKLKLTHISAGLNAGDIIVMASDGITEADRDDLNMNWLMSYLSKNSSKVKSPKALANGILLEAQKKYKKRERDDLTVLVAIIHDRKSYEKQSKRNNPK